MAGLIIFFNDICLHSSFVEQNEYLQAAAAYNCVALIVDILAIRPDCKVAVRGVERTLLAGAIRHFCASARDKYRRLLLSLIDAPAVEPGFLSEVSYMGVTAYGMTMADIVARDWQDGWIVGLSSPGGTWASATISASRYTLAEDGMLEGPTTCHISYISTIEHVARWRQALLDWGASVSPSSRLADISGHPLVMYSAPHEHNPPHIHLLESSASSKTLAKYRIDVFERASGPPTWDVQVKEWVGRHHVALLKSWIRCQSGGKPYAIALA